MNKFFKKLFGIDKIEQEIADFVLKEQTAKLMSEEAESQATKAIKEAEQAIEEARLAKLTPKDRATEKKEPYAAVLDTKVNEQNPRNGFFELDWNEYFILQLKVAGYYGETDEEIVDRWFTSLCQELGKGSGINMADRGSGYINVNKLGDGKSEIY